METIAESAKRLMAGGRGSDRGAMRRGGTPNVDARVFLSVSLPNAIPSTRYHVLLQAIKKRIPGQAQ
jgi:hypothetical protein